MCHKWLELTVLHCTCVPLAFGDPDHPRAYDPRDPFVRINDPLIRITNPLIRITDPLIRIT